LLSAVGISSERVAKMLALGRKFFLKLCFHLCEYLNEGTRLTAASGAELGERPTTSLVNLV
jgi:hypothetical protein